MRRAPNVHKHALGLGMLHDGLSAHGVEFVNLADRVALSLRVQSGPLLVMLGAIASRLILG